MSLPEAYAALAMWAVSQGADNLPATPGLWTGKLGQFRVAINGHMEPNATDDGLTVPPLTMLVDNRDYLGCILVVGPNGGAGAPGLEDEIIALAIANTPPQTPTKAEGVDG